MNPDLPSEDSAPDRKPSDELIRCLSEHQPQLVGFIYAATGNHHASQEILQKTNLAMWSKAEDFDATRPFMAWAIGFARFEILAYRRDAKRSRLLYDSDVIEEICRVAEELTEEVPDRLEALRHCLAKLTKEKQTMLQLRYASQLSLDEIASRVGRTVDGVKAVLRRTRAALALCIDQQLRNAN